MVAIGFTFAFLTFEPLAQRPLLIFGFAFLIDLGVIALVLLDHDIAVSQPLAGMAVFGLLAVWTAHSLNESMLNTALAFYFVFAVLHTGFPVAFQKKCGVSSIASGGQIFPPIALALVLIPIFRLTEVSFAVWPFVLLVDVLAIGLAVWTASIIAGNCGALTHARRNGRIDFQNSRNAHRPALFVFSTGRVRRVFLRRQRVVDSQIFAGCFQNRLAVR